MSSATVLTISVPALCEYLTDLVEWEVFAQYLPGIEQADIKIIQRDKQGDVKEQKRVLFDKWLQVHPNALWNDVVKALENPAVRENAIAQQLREKIKLQQQRTFKLVENENATSGLPIGGLSMSTSSNSQSSVLSVSSNTAVDEVSIDEEVVTKLDSLEQSFCDLTVQVKSGVEATEEKKGNIKNVVFSVQQARSFRIDSLQSVKTTDELFEAIRPHYNFLNCHLIIRIALFLCGVVADKATEYKEGIMKFMKTTKIACLKGVLQRYHRQRKFLPRRDDYTIIEIKVENAWGDQPLWLVEMLVETLFPVKHSDELPWYEIVPGSIVMTFLALKQMVPYLIGSSGKKTEFMRLLGIISLKKGDKFVWERKPEDAVFSFDDSLLRATLADNIEAVQFILQYTRVDINATNSAVLSFQNMDLYRKIIASDEVTNQLKAIRAVFVVLRRDIEQVLQYMKPSSGHPDHEFLNHQNLTNILPHLPKSLARRVEYYIQSLENDLKKCLLLPDFAEQFLAKYFPTPFPGSIEVIITLHSVWSNCSLWYVEQLVQLIFTPTLFYQLQWYRVDVNQESVKICFLSDKELHSNLAENCLLKNDNLQLSLLGVISVQIDDTVLVTNDYSDGYTFIEAIELAKAIGDGEMLDLLQQIQNSIKPHYLVVLIQDNANYSFQLDPDSTPLMIACCNDNSQLVQLLLDHNADLNKQNGRGATALMYSTGNNKIFQMLLDHGARTDIVTIYNESLAYFASIAGNVRVMKKVLKSSLNYINSKDSKAENTPLILASACNHVALVKALLEAGADPDIQNTKGTTALMQACKNNNEEIVELLLQAKADPDIRNDVLKTAISLTTNDSIVNQLVKANATIASSLEYVHYVNARFEDNLEAEGNDLSRQVPSEVVTKFQKFMSTGISTESDKLGLTLWVAIFQGKISLAKVMLQTTKVNVNFMALDSTPLMAAVQGLHIELVKILLQAKADPNIQSPVNGNTALMLACLEDNVELVSLLLEAGADPTIANHDGHTALDCASDVILEMLLMRLQ